MRRPNTTGPSAGAFFTRHRRALSALTLGLFALTNISPALAGGYVDGDVVLDPARAIDTGAVSVTPTFNNDQFNDQLLVGTVNNDPVRTPSTADPVSTVSGNNYHDETDFVIRGRNGLNTVFTRTYNSAPSATRVDRGLGYGWTHSYMMRLVSNDFGACPNCTSAQAAENGNSKTSSITYTDERGGEQAFLVDEATYAVSPPKGVYDTLTLDSPSAGQHTLTFRNGVKYIFETPSGTLKATPGITARLKYIDNAWGDRLTLGYDANGRLLSITDNLGIAGRTGLTFGYDGTTARLNTVTDWTGRQWYYARTGNNDLEFVQRPDGSVLYYGYDGGSHRLTEVRKPLQRDGKTVATRFAYYQNGRTFQQTNSFGQGDTLDYDLYRKSTRVTDARGFVREYHYNENGRMTKLVEPDGGVLVFENQADAIRSKKYDALGYATAYSYRLDRAFTGNADANGNVTREQDALNQVVDTTYGPLDQTATLKDKRGTTVTTTFGSATSGCDYVNRPKETRISALAGQSNVLLSSHCWNSNGTLDTSREYLDATRYRETRLTYTDNGLNVSQEQIVGMPSGVTVTKTYTYDNLGRVKTETLKRRTSPTNAALIDLTTTYTYDALDRVTKTVDVLGNEVINAFDANGQLWRVTHRYKKPDATFEVRDVVTRTFDAADRVKTETDAEGNTTSYTYDDAGNVIAVLDSEGHTTRFEYDAMNRRTAVIDATGYRTETKYSQRGDVMAITNANDETVRFEIDALGRKSAAIDARGYRSEYQYDEAGNLTCTIDANAQAGLQPKNTYGCSESRQYDELGRVTKILDALNGETRFTYDRLGNRLTVTDAENKTWSFAYDDLGRLKSETDHSGKTISYKPDEAGNVFEKTDRLGEVTRYSFDAASRLTRVDYLVDGSSETFGYDPAGNRSAAANGSVGYSFQYDRLNRLTSKLDSRGRSLSFTYDAVGNILTKTTYQGSTTGYVYNAANRLVMLTNPDYTQVDYQYDPAGRLLSRVTANGARMTQTFDANGWLESQNQYDAANDLVSDISYTRDRVGNILTSDDGAGTTAYTYDALYRLESADYPGTANDEAFAYDKVGNRKTHTQGSTTPNASTRYFTYTAGTNRLANIRIGSTTGTIEASFTHDLEGRLTSQSGVGAKTLTWDAKGRLWTLTDTNGTEVYDYDPMDHRIGRSGGQLGNRSYFLEGEHLESVYDGAGNLKEKYFRGSSIDELVAAWMEDTDGKTKPYLFHHDNVNNVTAVSGHNGGTTQAITYSAFGQTQSSTGASPNRLKYTGREDDGSGLYYYRARYYDPLIGRFISEDPIGFASGDMSFYVYAGNNPVNANDPSGHNPVTKFIRESAEYLGVQATGAALRAAKERGVAAAWKMEQQLVRATGEGTRAGGWTPAQVQELLSTGKVRGFVGDHINSANASPARAGLSDNIQFLTTAEHAARHSAAGGTQVPLYGSLIDRTAGGTLPRLTNSSGYSIRSTLLSAGAATLGLAADVVEAAELFMPSTYMFGINGTGGCNASGVCSDQMNWNSLGPPSSYSPAGGGFLLYPNKANTNMMQSVYSK